MTRFVRAVILIGFTLASLTACGGGGGSAPTASPPPPPPPVNTPLTWDDGTWDEVIWQ
jgi:hypothetical protein